MALFLSLNGLFQALNVPKHWGFPQWVFYKPDVAPVTNGANVTEGTEKVNSEHAVIYNIGYVVTVRWRRMGWSLKAGTRPSHLLSTADWPRSSRIGHHRRPRHHLSYDPNHLVSNLITLVIISYITDLCGIVDTYVRFMPTIHGVRLEACCFHPFYQWVHLHAWIVLVLDLHTPEG